MKAIIEDLLGDPELRMAVRHAINKRLISIHNDRLVLDSNLMIDVRINKKLREESEYLIELLEKYP